MSPPRFVSSSKGRRPPFYLLADPKDLEDISMEDSELMDVVYFEDYDDGTLEGVRRWIQELEALTNWVYQPGTPCLVDPVRPGQHAEYLLEAAFSVRNQGAPVVASAGRSLLLLLNSSSFDRRYVKPWLKLSKQEQEKLLLDVYGDYERQDPEKTKVFSRNAKLVPELRLSQLLGQGLISLTNHLRVHLVDPNKLSTNPIPNELFFAKFESIPLIPIFLYREPIELSMRNTSSKGIVFFSA